MKREDKIKLDTQLAKESHPLDLIYKQTVKLISEVDSVNIYCQEMERYTRDLKNKLTIHRLALKEAVNKK